MFEMLGLFWNCRGVGKRGMATCIVDLIKDHILDLLGLQETIKKNHDMSFFFKNLILMKPSSGNGFLMCGELVVSFVVLDLSI